MRLVPPRTVLAPPRRLRQAVGAVALALLASVGAAGLPSVREAAAEDAYGKVLAERASDLASKAFHRRSRAWRALASLKDRRALKRFAQDYAKAEPGSHVQGFLASLACDTFDAATDLPALRAWCETRDAATDAWLWYRVALREVEHGRAADVAARVTDAKRPAELRAASMLALAAWADDAVPAAVEATLASLPGAGDDRPLLLEAAVRALRSQAGRYGSPAYRALALRVVEACEAAGTTDRTRLLLGRVLAHAAGLPRPLRSATGWRLLLEGGLDPSRDDEGRTYAPPVEFMDVVTTGHRIGFVIDASGSMEAPLTPEERQDLLPPADKTPLRRPGGETTPGADAGRGGKARDGAKPPAAGPASSADGLMDVPLRWQRVRTRYDAALEFTRAAVARLGEDVRFGACLFGDGTADLVRPGGLLAATAAARADLLKAVDVRLNGSGTMGQTNLHGGIVRMLRTVDGGLRADATYVDRGVARSGVDTLYVLSDGAPTADEFGQPTSRTGDLDLAGSYADPAQLLDELDRWNLFRAVEVNTVGLGADPLSTLLDDGGPLAALLRQMAWRHGGSFRPVPRPARAKDPAPGADPASRARRMGDLLEEALRRLPPDQRERLRRLLDDEPLRPDGGVPPADGPARKGGPAERSRPGPAAWVDALLLEGARAQDAAAALDALAGRRWGWCPGMRAHERKALWRNWTWWLELHPPK